MSEFDDEKRAVFACLRGCFIGSESARVMRTNLADCFAKHGLAFHPDVPLAFNAGRIDFLSASGYAVLVASCREQLDDVALHVRCVAADSRVKQLLVITTRAAHRKVPGGVSGKPVDVFWIGGVS